MSSSASCGTTSQATSSTTRSEICSTARRAIASITSGDNWLSVIWPVGAGDTADESVSAAVASTGCGTASALAAIEDSIGIEGSATTAKSVLCSSVIICASANDPACGAEVSNSSSSSVSESMTKASS